MTSETKQNASNPTIEDMLKAGVHFGHKTSKWNPKMESYIFTSRNNIHIFDLEQTSSMLSTALDLVGKVVSEGGEVIFIGTNPGIKKIVKEAALKCGMPYVDKRWLGGTLTNFKNISKRLSDYRNLEKKLNDGGFESYTKKEQLKLRENLEKMTIKFGGLKQLERMPKALLIFSLKDEETAAREGKMTNVPVIAIADTNSDPSLADYLIPGNDDAISAVTLIADSIANAVNLSKSKTATTTEAKK